MSDRMAGILDVIAQVLTPSSNPMPTVRPHPGDVADVSALQLVPDTASSFINDAARYGRQAVTGSVSDGELLNRPELQGDARTFSDALGDGFSKLMNYGGVLDGPSGADVIGSVVDAYQGAKPGLIDALGESAVNRLEGAGLLASMVLPSKVRNGVGDTGFYSQAVRAAEGLQRKQGNADGFFNDLTGKGQVKPDELNAMGFKEHFAGRNDVSREEVQQFINDNQLQIKETRLGVPEKYVVRPDPDEGFIVYDSTNGNLTSAHATQEIAASKAMELNESVDNSKFATYTLDGGDNYRELLMSLPMDKDYENFVNPGHFDEPNILAHLRMKDRVDVDGNKTLLIEEVQSDWHQKGADVGYKPKGGSVSKTLQEEMDRIENEMVRVYEASRASDDPDVWMPLNEQFNNLNSELGRLKYKADEGVPDAPFKTDDKSSWYNLAMKRGLLEAVEGGYDKLAITTGRQQASRYDLSNHIDNLQLREEVVPNNKASGGDPLGERKVYLLDAYNLDGNKVINKVMDSPEKELPSIVGKEVAQKLLDQKAKKIHSEASSTARVRTLNNANLSVGGEGMKQFYDRTLPNTLNKLVKQDGAKVGQTNLPSTSDSILIDDIDYSQLSTAERQELENLEKAYRDFSVNFDVSQEARMKELRSKARSDTVHSIDITPKMRERVKKGLPLFAIAGGVGLTEMMSQRQQQEPSTGLFNSLQY